MPGAALLMKAQYEPLESEMTRLEAAVECLDFELFSVQPLCLRGYRIASYNNHRVTEDTEVAQRNPN